jgi:fibronectin-binding autotransporter adhesin
VAGFLSAGDHTRRIMKTKLANLTRNLFRVFHAARWLLFLALTCSFAVPSLAATRSWTGDGGFDINFNRIWSNPDNWSPNGVPQNGENLQFIDPLSPDLFMVNDLTNLTVSSLYFGIADIGDAEVHLYGQPLGISTGIYNTYDFECQVYIHCDLKLAGNATFITGNTQTTPAIFSEETQMHLIGAIDLNGHNLVLKADATYANEGRLYVEGGISGVGNIVGIAAAIQVSGGFDYPGKLEFKGPGNTFSGSLTLNAESGSQILLNVSSGVVANNLVVITNRGNTQFGRANQLGDGATVRLANSGVLNLNGYLDTIQNLELLNVNSVSHPSTLKTEGGTLTVSGNITSINDHASVEPTIQGRLALSSGEHIISVSGAAYAGLDIQAELAGFGNFSKSGNAALLLSASNSFNSSIFITEGILDVRHNHGLGDIAGSTAIGAGALTLRNVAIGEELLFALGQGTGGELPGSVLTVVGSSSWAGQVGLYTNLVIVGGDMTFTGPIFETGGLGCFSGGTIRLGGTLANTYTGPTLVRCPLVEFAKPSGVKAYAGPLIVGGGFGGPTEARWLNSYQNLYANVTLYDNGTLNLNNFFEDLGPLTFNGGTITTGTGELGIYGLVTVNSNAAAAIISGKMGLPVGFREFRVADGGGIPDLLVNAVVLGSGHLQKTGTGQMALAGANTYSGLTLVEAGTLSVQNVSALGGTASGTIVQDGATLAFSSVSGAVGEVISLRGAGVGGTSGALSVNGPVLFRNQFPSIYAALDLTTNATIRVAFGAGLILDGFVSGTGPLTKFGDGSLVFSNSNPNTYIGDTIIQAGTLELRKPTSVIAVPGNLVLGPASAGPPATARWFQTGGMNASSNATVNANSLIDLNGNNQNLNRLNLNDGGDVQTGAGKLTFLTGGPITVGSLNPAGSQASSSFSGSIGLPANGTLSFVVGQYAVGTIGVTEPELAVSAAIPVPVENVNFERAGVYKSGGGELRLTGNNTFNGRVDVSAGALTVGSATALGTTFDATYITGGASLALINGITVNGEILSLNSTNSAALNNRGGNNTWTGPITLARASNIGVTTDWSLLLSGAISGSGSLTKVGAGTLTLSGGANNTHAGNTFVNEGTLALNKVYGFQAVPASLVIGESGGGPAALVRFLNNDQVWQHITVNPNGLLDLNNFDEYANDVTLNGGGDVQTGTGALYVLGLNGLTVNPANNNPATITGRLGFDAGNRTINVAAGTTTAEAHDLDISAVIFQANPTVNLTKTGAGRARFGGTNTYTGTTTVSGGQLQIDGSQPQSPVLISGARLQGSGIIGHVTFSGSAVSRLAPGTSAGILTTSNFNATAVGGGAVELDLNGAVAGNSYDQLNVRGSVNLTGLSLQSTLNYTSTATQQYTLVNNDGSDAVTGIFTGLPQNKKLYIGSELFQISYTGGSGNDVVLTRLVTPPPPTLTIQRVSPASVRLLWPTNDPAFRLLSHTNLTTPNWVAVTPQPTLVGTNHILTNVISGVEKYYRLVNP